MSNRITSKDLDRLIITLNKLTSSPTDGYTRDTNGNLKANIGHYHIDSAYGGNKLVRMMNEGGGVTVPIPCGYVSKRELYQLIHAYMAGLGV